MTSAFAEKKTVFKNKCRFIVYIYIYIYIYVCVYKIFFDGATVPSEPLPPQWTELFLTSLSNL